MFKENHGMYQQDFNPGGAQNPQWQNDQTSVRVNTMEFPEDETDRFFVGAEDHNVYQGSLHASSS